MMILMIGLRLPLVVLTITEPILSDLELSSCYSFAFVFACLPLFTGAIAFNLSMVLSVLCLVFVFLCT